MVVVITPKLTGLDRSALGAPYWARLKTLNKSARKRIFTFSVMFMYFERPRSNWEIPGARKASRPRLPKVWKTVLAKASGLIQLLGVDPPAGVSEPPAT